MTKRFLFLAATAALTLSSQALLAQDGSKSPLEAEVKVGLAAPQANLSDEELLELVGYHIAHAVGIAGLQLDDQAVATVSKSLARTFAGEVDPSALDEAEIEVAIAQATSRGEAVASHFQAKSGGENPSPGVPRVLTVEELATVPTISESSLDQLGVLVALQSRLMELDFTGEELKPMIKGFIRGARDAVPTAEVMDNSQAMGDFLQTRSQQMMAKRMAEASVAAIANKKAGADFVAALEDVESTESGLHYKVIEPGEGPKPTMDDTVLVHYEGTRIDGTVFDSSYKRGKPTEFPMKGVVAGFSEGLTKVAKGGKVKLYIPSDLGYGDTPRGNTIQAGDTLIFTCELVDINPGAVGVEIPQPEEKAE